MGRGDKLLRISLLGGMARAYLIDSTDLCEEARSMHALSRVASAALGRLLTGASIMGAMLKNEGESLTVRVNGGGPVGALVVVAEADASVRGYVDNPSAELPSRGDKLDVGACVGARGELVVVKDFGMKEPYVGRVPLVSGEIAEDLAAYIASSEQIPSLVSLGVLVGGRVVAAGGLAIQPLPGIDETSLKSIEYGSGMYENISATIAEYGAEGSVFQLLAHLDPVVTDVIVPEYRCGCTRERMERALVALGEAELREMISDRGGAEMTCHFCKVSRRFSSEEMNELLLKAIS